MGAELYISKALPGMLQVSKIAHLPAKNPAGAGAGT